MGIQQFSIFLWIRRFKNEYL